LKIHPTTENRPGLVRRVGARLTGGGLRLPRVTHGLAHACVCAVVLLSWSLPGGLSDRTPVPARLSEDEVDAVLQRAASSALGGREGTVMVLDAQTGRVRALVNPHLAFEEATPPGSAIKPFTMLTALRAGSLDEDSRVLCRGRYSHEDFKIACAHPRYKTPFGPAQALANSCNYFFARAAETLDGDAYARTLRAYGFGATTHSAAEREVAGQLPRETPRVPEMLGESEQLRVTPAQMVTAYAALFNGGRLLVPQRARSDNFTPRVRATLEAVPLHRALLLAGMRGAVAYGTAARAGLSTLPVYVFGKTGTSTPQDDWRAQGWFVGFAAEKSKGADKAPPEAVRLAVLVFLKRSRGAEAAEVSRPIFEAYARTLDSQDDTRLADSLTNKDGRGAMPSGSSEEGGTTVRVRLSREDATLSLTLDEYVFGVLAAEGSIETRLEALKALAVVSRTYALKNLRRHARDRFDLCDTTHCQRFLPVRDEGARPEFYELARRAVRETAGEVLREPSGRVAEVYFSAACGGRTADISKLWGVRDAPAQLRGVRDDFCGGASETWTDVIPAPQLLGALRADERSDVGARLDDVRVLRRDASGRAELVALEGERRRIVRGWDFKIIVGRTLGWSVVKSSHFEVARAGASFVFRGRGFGHGLGLCQAGARVMAGRGQSYRQILMQYFPGTNVGDASGTRRDVAGVSPASDRVTEGEMTVATLDDEPSGHATVVFDNASFTSDAADARAPSSDFLARPLRLTSASRSAAPLDPNASSSRLLLSSEHFRMSYPSRGPRRDAEAILRTLESAHADVSRRLENASLGTAGLERIEVYVHETTGDFIGVTGQPAWAGGATSGRRIDLQPLEVLRRRGALATTLRHEFVHVALEVLGRGRAPRWLAEGLSLYVAGEGRALARSAPKEGITTDELERRLARPAPPEEMRALYAAAYAEVAALVRRDGEASVWRRALR
jgi:stage II sporulation protein D